VRQKSPLTIALFGLILTYNQIIRELKSTKNLWVRYPLMSEVGCNIGAYFKG
jgi:hypothetical protein